mmetsp:Transcript_62057/g.181946  ORF Transcript_62057/g.181946 Transcript_62057/m.181946 type:complete len:298 (+) Transcript_62057:868-1761(+)
MQQDLLLLRRPLPLQSCLRAAQRVQPHGFRHHGRHLRGGRGRRGAPARRPPLLVLAQRGRGVLQHAEARELVECLDPNLDTGCGHLARGRHAVRRGDAVRDVADADLREVSGSAGPGPPHGEGLRQQRDELVRPAHRRFRSEQPPIRSRRGEPVDLPRGDRRHRLRDRPARAGRDPRRPHGGPDEPLPHGAGGVPGHDGLHGGGGASRDHGAPPPVRGRPRRGGDVDPGVRHREPRAVHRGLLLRDSLQHPRRSRLREHLLRGVSLPMVPADGAALAVPHGLRARDAAGPRADLRWA